MIFIYRIPGSHVLISSLQGSASRTRVESLVRTCNSTKVLEALTGKFYIRRCKPGILYVYKGLLFLWHWCRAGHMTVTWQQYQCNNLFIIYSNIKPVLSSHSKLDKTKVLMTNGSLMKVKSIPECSPSAILLTCIEQIVLEYHFGLFENDHFWQVLL